MTAEDDALLCKAPDVGERAASALEERFPLALPWLTGGLCTG